MTNLQTNLVETEKAMRPVARFLGDSLAAAIGFAGLAVVSLVPISVLHLIKRWGNADLANSLHWLEIALFAVDIMPFLAVFLAGAAVFATEVYVETETRSIELLQRRKK